MTDTLQRRQIIRDIVRRIVAAYAPEAVILYGSHAYGTPHEDSDIDLLIIKETDKSHSDRWSAVRDLLGDPYMGVPVSPLVYTPRELQRRLAIGDFFVREILQKGEFLYGDCIRETPLMDEGLKLQALEWFERGDGDLQGARVLLDQGAATYIVAFHVHQTIEKYLKGYLILHDRKPPRSHELAPLLESASRFRPELLREYADLCEKATKYYVKGRYPPGPPPQYDPKEMVARLAQTEQLVRAIREEADS